jgi:CheY-like chemotaxis protein
VSNKDVRVIVMTGRIDTGTTAFQTLCRRFKTEKILTKPFTSKQLLDSVNELLPRKN